jgi:hypothetical protein
VKLQLQQKIKFNFHESFPNSAEAEFRKVLDDASKLKHGAFLNDSGPPITVRATSKQYPITGGFPDARLLVIDPRDPAYLDPGSRVKFQKWPTELPPDGHVGRMILLVHEAAHIIRNTFDEGFGGHNVRDYENPFRADVHQPDRQSYSGNKVYPEDPFR